MAERKRWQVLRPVAMGAAALVLSGCTATHVGEDWQCPLAQGEVCTSVADADPAVPAARETGPPALETLVPDVPLYRPHAGGDAQATGAAGADAEAGCESGCGPLAWLERVFDRLAGDDGEAAAAGPSSSGPAPDSAAAVDGAEASLPPHADPDEGDGAERVVSIPAARSAESLREPEVLGRVWIAPFVDADGIYREGAWVRLVIEPARWRLQ